MVEAHNASQAQLSRMDSSYKTNLAAMDTDWKASLSRYQADMSREMAKQYEYGASMADWQGGPMANAAYNNAIQSANDTATAGYISATGSLLSAAGGMMKPSASTGNFAPTQSVGGKLYVNDTSAMMYRAVPTK